MSFALGFLKGFADTARSGIEARQAEESERKKIELLERLRRETAQFEYDLQEKRNKKTVDKQQTSIDLEAGVKVIRNQYGEEIDRIPLTASEIESGRLSLDADRLTVEDKRSTIDSRARDDARADRLADAQIGAYSRSNRDDGTARSPKGHKILLAEAERVFSDVQDRINPTMMGNFKRVFYQGVNHEGWSESKQRQYLQQVYEQTFKSWKNLRTGKTRRPLQEVFPAETRSLIKD